MRPIIIIISMLAGFAAPAAAQDVSLPHLTFPEPGTFCGLLQLCAPDTTQDTGE